MLKIARKAIKKICRNLSCIWVEDLINGIKESKNRKRTFPQIGESRLKDLFPLKKCTIAIVGNGPSEIGQMSGKEIDACDYVIRFNNYSTEIRYKEDYGAKTDIWVTCLAENVIVPSCHIRLVICPFPVISKKLEYLKRYPIDMNFPMNFDSKIHIIPQRYFSDLKKHLNNPSTGLALLYWLYRENERSIDSVKIFGFSFFKDKIHHYCDDFKLCTHNGNVECDLVDQMKKHNLY